MISSNTTLNLSTKIDNCTSPLINSVDGKKGERTGLGASPTTPTRRVLSGFNKYFKKVIEGVKKKIQSSKSEPPKHRQAKSYRRGFYTLLYGGCVDKNTFYDYLE